MPVKISYSNTYYWLNSWVLANIIQLATQSFCRDHLDFRDDPAHRLFDQMVMAARSAVANIAEGNARHNTSLETEMRLTDVARASISELQGDFFNFLLRTSGEVWLNDDIDTQAIWKTVLDKPNYGGNLLHDVAIHIHRQMEKFDKWLNPNASPQTKANCLILLCGKLNSMLQNMLLQQLEQFKQSRGFSENMTESRMQSRRLLSEAPKCQRCGAPMVKRMAKKGINAGREFWSCSNYQSTGCTFVIPIS